MSAATLLDLQMKYPNAVLRLQTTEADLLHQPMNETQFWAIIAALNWKILDNDAIIAPAAETLSHFSLIKYIKWIFKLSEKNLKPKHILPEWIS
jgi:hypothetical protein